MFKKISEWFNYAKDYITDEWEELKGWAEDRLYETDQWLREHLPQPVMSFLDALLATVGHVGRKCITATKEIASNLKEYLFDKGRWPATTVFLVLAGAGLFCLLFFPPTGLAAVTAAAIAAGVVGVSLAAGGFLDWTKNRQLDKLLRENQQKNITITTMSTELNDLRTESTSTYTRLQTAEIGRKQGEIVIVEISNAADQRQYEEAQGRFERTSTEINEIPDLGELSDTSSQTSETPSYEPPPIREPRTYLIDEEAMDGPRTFEF